MHISADDHKGRNITAQAKLQISASVLSQHTPEVSIEPKCVDYQCYIVPLQRKFNFLAEDILITPDHPRDYIGAKQEIIMKKAGDEKQCMTVWDRPMCLDY
ncbi:unnamed protein product [Hermetia illucens]|uniref:Uncharacterized protein n=1 Tax=Hermetia illucens TaxID=343691 RepID=A0A7R8YW02_HERIL|nr:unnamed protein product [Hermetia illucens]